MSRLPYISDAERLEAQMHLIRVTLGLNPIHDVLTAVRVLHDEGREAFEKLRGPRCEHAHEWKGPMAEARKEREAAIVDGRVTRLWRNP
jgi:hypothetical protein